MRVFAVSDLHVDYPLNLAWLQQLSLHDYRHDVLILAGDLSDSLELIAESFEALARRFAHVMYVPGNHDLWVNRDGMRDSFAKLDALQALAGQHGVRMTPLRLGGLALVPLLGWYDYSFGEPSDALKNVWMDYRACVWPSGYDDVAVTGEFTGRNAVAPCQEAEGATTVISFSHFLPRIDLMPDFVPERHRLIYPVLGTSVLETQLRQLGAHFHVYGHSHVNRHVTIDGVTYINNAFGYPSESHFTARQLLCVHTTA
ncbi:metallophosphoesterase [Dyella silvatica]|uniref:metallophosphoesterase n=1 Tax=Dyella silvatica TaxID=2992128 RepID=UPI0022549112|nr:metallophosphoesterase [Dyella silvatica]